MWRAGEGRDKAGGYAIQGLASRFIPRIEGSYSNVVGLPVSTMATSSIWRAISRRLRLKLVLAVRLALHRRRRAILSVPFPEVLMTHRYIKIGITASSWCWPLPGCCGPRCAKARSTYKHVDEVMANPQEWQGKRLQLHGYVVTNSILVQARHPRVPIQGPEQRRR